MSAYHGLRDEFRELLREGVERGGEELRRVEIEKQLSQTFGLAQVGLEIEQSVIERPVDAEQRAFLQGASGGAVVRTKLAFGAGASIPATLLEIGRVSLGAKVGMALEVPVRFPAFEEGDDLAETARRAVEGAFARIGDALLEAIPLDVSRLQGWDRGTRFDLSFDLEGAFDSTGAPLRIGASAATSVRSSYQRLAGDGCRISVERPTRKGLEAGGTLPIEADVDFGFEVERSVVRQRTQVFEADLSRDFAAVGASLPWARDDHGWMLRVDTRPLAELRRSTSILVIQKARYELEASGSPHPAITLSGSFTRDATRRVGVVYVGREGNLERAKDLGLLALESVQAAPAGSSVAHLTQGEIQVEGKLLAGRSLGIADVAKLSATAGLSVAASRDRQLLLSVHWPKRGKPIVELTQLENDEIAADASLKVGLEVTEAGEQQARGLIRTQLAALHGLEAAAQPAADAGIKAAAQAIASYVQATLTYGGSWGQTDRLVFAFGPFDLDQPEHRLAFEALRNDHDVRPATRAGLLLVRSEMEEETDTARFQLGFFGQRLRLSSWDAFAGGRVAFETPRGTRFLESSGYRGGEENGFHTFIGPLREEAKYEWRIATIVDERDGRRAVRDALLGARIEVDDGKVEFDEARRWQILLDVLRPKVELLRSESRLEDDSSDPGQGALAFQISRSGLEAILSTDLVTAHDTFLSLATRIAGVAGLPTGELYDGLPFTFRVVKLLQAGGSSDADFLRRRFPWEFPTADLMEIQEAAGVCRRWLASQASARRDLEQRYAERFDRSLRSDARRYGASEILWQARNLGKPTNTRERHKLRELAVRYRELTGRSPDSYVERLAPSSSVSVLRNELRLVIQEEIFSRALFDLQELTRERAEASDPETLRLLFERLGNFAHRITPGYLGMIQDRAQDYLAAHVLTLLSFAGPGGFSVSELAYDSERLDFEAAKRPAELDLDRMIGRAMEEEEAHYIPTIHR